MRLDQPAFAEGFSGATIIRIQIDGEAYCLRRWPIGGLAEQRIRELHRFLRFIDHSGLHVFPLPVTSKEGDTLVDNGGQLWQLEPWMPGVADFRKSPSDVRLESTMRVLAQVHNIASRYGPTEAGRKWFSTGLSLPSPAVGERIGILDRWSPERISHTQAAMQNDRDRSFGEVATRILQVIRESHDSLRSSLVSLSTTHIPVHPCLRDIWHDHVLYTGDDVTGVIDPSAARTESVASDLSRLLGSLLGESNSRWSHALETYEQGRPLSITEHRLIRVLHVSGVMLGGLTWIDRRLQDRIRTEMMSRVVQRMDEACRTLEHLKTARSDSGEAGRLL